MACCACRGHACAERLFRYFILTACSAQEEAVEYVAATVRKLTQEAAAEGIRRLFLISVCPHPLFTRSACCWQVRV